jgi:hypothetical protein
MQFTTLQNYVNFNNSHPHKVNADEINSELFN